MTDLYALEKAEAERDAAVAGALERAAQMIDSYVVLQNPVWVQPRHALEHCAKVIRTLKPRSDLVCVPREPVAWIWHYKDGHSSLRWRPDYDPTSTDVPSSVTALYAAAKGKS